MRSRRGRTTFGLLGIVASLLGCTERSGPARALGLHECHLPGITETTRCGYLDVFENRETKAGRQLRLHVAVIEAQGAEAEPDPIFLLAGGPGQGASEGFAPALPALGRLNETRTLVLVDQRGTGRSGALTCPADLDDTAALFEEDQISKGARECLPKLNADLAEYSSDSSADDLDDVRAALGYPRINLLGGSYGTRLALVYLRRHPERVRSVVLDGAVPTDMALPLSFARDTDRSMARLFSDCANDAACAGAFRDLPSAFDKIVGELAKAPREVSFSHPRTGKLVSFRLTRDTFAALVRGLLYVPELSALLPLAIKHAAEGDFSRLVASSVVLLESSEKTLSFGLFLSVICREDIPRLTEAAILQETSGTLLGQQSIRELQKACTTWPVRRAPDEFFAPVSSDAPVLILSGDLDPATPPRFGERVAAHLPKSRHVVVPGASHGTLTRGPVPALLEEFFKLGSAAALDVQEVAHEQRPPFFIDFAGPTH